MSYKLRNEFIGPKHRMYQPMLELQTLCSGVLLSMEAVLLEGAVFQRWKPDTTFQSVTAQFPSLAFRLNYFAPMFAAAHGLQVGDIQVRVTNAEAKPDDVPIPQAHNAINRALLSIAVLTYIAFYERWRPEVEARFTTEIVKWPALFAFARRIRDFVVHANGKIAFSRPGSAPVHWHKLSYSPSDNGRVFINTDIAFADFLALMFELDEEMTTLGFSTA